MVLRDIPYCYSRRWRNASRFWRLLTSEPINDFDAVQRIVRDYELRWRTEEYHKAWKPGVGRVDRRTPAFAKPVKPGADAVVITAFVAVRLLQLREAMEVCHRAVSHRLR